MNSENILLKLKHFQYQDARTLKNNSLVRHFIYLYKKTFLNIVVRPCNLELLNFSLPNVQFIIKFLVLISSLMSE